MLNKRLTVIPILMWAPVFAAATFNVIFAQQTSVGSQIKTGVWKGEIIEYVDGHILLKIKSGVSRQALMNYLTQHQTQMVQDLDVLRWGLIKVTDGMDIFAKIEQLQSSPFIEAIEPNGIIHTTLDPNDPFFLDGHQYALKNTGQSPPGGTVDADIDAPEAWSITTGSSNIVIAILDSGIPMLNGTLSHPDLDNPNKIILGQDVLYPDLGESDPSVRDELGHGTHVAGIAAAETNNNTGIAGVAWNCKIMVIQVFNAGGSGTWNAFKNGVIYAVDNGAKLVNFSGGGLGYSQAAEDAVVYANSNNVTLVASAGNDYCSSILYPARFSASYNNVIAVGATQYNDQRAGYSNCGSQLNVVAPGGAHDGGYPVDPGDIYSTMPNYQVTLNGYPYYVTPNYGYLPGTSMAAPHVSGVAGLMLSLAPSLTPLQIRNTLQQTAEDKGPAGKDNEYGYGRINAYNAVNLIVSAPAAPENLRIANPGQNGAHPILAWDTNSEPDLDHYLVWRGWTPNWKTTLPTWEGYPAASVTGTTWTDNEAIIDLYVLSATYYRLTAVDEADNESNYSNQVMTTSGPLPKSREEKPLTASPPQTFALQPNYPNPFNPETKIRFDLPEGAHVVLEIYNVLGEKMRTLVDNDLESGFHSISWDGKDENGKELPSGIYIYRFRAKSGNLASKSFVAAKKLTLLR